MRKFAFSLFWAALLAGFSSSCRAAESFWFTGQFGALGSVHVLGGSPVSFYLIGGNYLLYIRAARPGSPGNPASRSCFFNGNLQRIEPTHDVMRIGTTVPISTIVPYKLGPTTISFPPGLYALYVTSMSDCDWTVAINSTSDNQAGVSPVRMLKRISGRVIVSDSAALGETVEFIAQCRSAKDEKVPLTGTLQLIHDGSIFRSEPLRVSHENANGGDRVLVDLSFIANDSKYLGKNTAQFRVNIGVQEFTSTAEITLTK